MTGQAPATIRHGRFVLAVPDVAATARWWTDVMGFKPWMEPEGWRFLRRDGVALMLGECPDAIPPAQLGDHQYFAYFEVDSVDAYYAEIAPRGAEILSPPTDKDWSMREMAVRTPDGHRICVGSERR